MRVWSSIKNRLSIFSEIWYFLGKRKKWWLAPLIVFLLILALFIVFIELASVAPFIYTLF